MSTMERILRLMGEKKASDVYLSANAPALIKINGECVPINNQLLPPEATLNLLMDVVPPNRIEELKETGELNMAIPIYGVGNFRLSAMYVMNASEFHVNVGRANRWSNVSDSAATQWTLGYNYNLSKRTKVYTYYTKVNNKKGADYMTGTPGDDFSSFALGVRHNF